MSANHDRSPGLEPMDTIMSALAAFASKIKLSDITMWVIFLLVGYPGTF